MTMIILVGLPGSGKSTYAKKHYPDYVYINQDELKSRDVCAIKAREAIDAGRDVIIDRTNIDKRQRKVWTNLAKFYGVQNVECILLKVEPKECIKRINGRKNHPTIPSELPLDKKMHIVYTFIKSYEEPSLDEGFNSITVVDQFGNKSN